MAIQIKRNPLQQGAPQGDPESIDVAPNGINSARMQFSPEWQKNNIQRYSAATSVAAAPGRDLNALFATTNKHNDPRSITRQNAHGGNSEHTVTDEQDLQKLAASLGIPARDVAQISYTESRDKITEMSIHFREGTSPQKIAQYDSAITLALEKHGIVAEGTAFQLGERGITDPGKVGLNVTGAKGQERLQSIDFNGAQNSSGHDFAVKALQNGKTALVFGQNTQAPAHSGHADRLVTQDEYRAAQRIAAKLGGEIAGKPGISANGVSVVIDQPINHTIVDLSQTGIINRQLGGPLSAELKNIIIPGHNRSMLLENAALSMPASSQPHIQTPHIAAPPETQKNTSPGSTPVSMASIGNIFGNLGSVDAVTSGRAPGPVMSTEKPVWGAPQAVETAGAKLAAPSAQTPASGNPMAGYQGRRNRGALRMATIVPEALSAAQPLASPTRPAMVSPDGNADASKTRRSLPGLRL